jgi:hypothetical protein
MDAWMLILRDARASGNGSFGHKDACMLTAQDQGGAAARGAPRTTACCVFECGHAITEDASA